MGSALNCDGNCKWCLHWQQWKTKKINLALLSQYGRAIIHISVPRNKNRNLASDANKTLFHFYAHCPRANAQVGFYSRYSLHCRWLYIYHPFFLNLRVSRAKFENLRWQVRGDIIQVTFEKSVTSLVQNSKILGTKLICSHYLHSQFL